MIICLIMIIFKIKYDHNKTYNHLTILNTQLLQSAKKAHIIFSVLRCCIT